MTSDHYLYKIVAVYPDHRTAASAVCALDAAELDDIKVIDLAPDAIGPDRAINPERGANLDVAIRDTTVCSALGITAGAAKSSIVTAMAPALFVGAPVVAPLIVLGYGAMIGGAARAIRGLRLRENVLVDLVNDSLKAGYHVVILHAANGKARQHAEAVISATLPEQSART